LQASLGSRPGFGRGVLVGGLLMEPAEHVDEEFAGGGVCEDGEGECGPELTSRSERKITKPADW